MITHTVMMKTKEKDFSKIQKGDITMKKLFMILQN